MDCQREVIMDKQKLCQQYSDVLLPLLFIHSFRFILGNPAHRIVSTTYRQTHSNHKIFMYYYIIVY